MAEKAVVLWHAIRCKTYQDTHSMQGAAMRRKYRFSDLSKDEREYLEMILLEEIDVQRWYTITYCAIFGEELILGIQ